MGPVSLVITLKATSPPYFLLQQLPAQHLFGQVTIRPAAGVAQKDRLSDAAGGKKRHPQRPEEKSGGGRFFCETHPVISTTGRAAGKPGQKETYILLDVSTDSTPVVSLTHRCRGRKSKNPPI